jgi:hypothetical protein
MKVDTSIPIEDRRATPDAARGAVGHGFGGLMSPEIQRDPWRGRLGLAQVG